MGGNVSRQPSRHRATSLDSDCVSDKEGSGWYSSRCELPRWHSCWPRFDFAGYCSAQTLRLVDEPDVERLASIDGYHNACAIAKVHGDCRAVHSIGVPFKLLRCAILR